MPQKAEEIIWQSIREQEINEYDPSVLLLMQASSRSGVINLHLDEKNQRVLLRGKAVVVAEGSILV